MKSIMSNEKACFICGSTVGLHRHHIFYGYANRKVSEKEGCWCYLCGPHHNMSNYSVHYNKELDLKLKQQCQQQWEDLNGTRENFISMFGRSYL